MAAPAESVTRAEDAAQEQSATTAHTSTARRPAPTPEQIEQIGLGPFGVVGPTTRPLGARVRRAALAVGLPNAALDFACYLSTHADKHGVVKRRQEAMAQERKTTLRAVFNRFRQLIDAGVLMRTRRGWGRINHYAFCYRPHDPERVLDRKRDFRSRPEVSLPIKTGSETSDNREELLDLELTEQGLSGVATPVVVSASCEYKPRVTRPRARGDREQSATDTARPTDAAREIVLSRSSETTKSRKAIVEPARIRTVEVDPEDRELFEADRRLRREREAREAETSTWQPPPSEPADPHKASAAQVRMIRKLTRKFGQAHPNEAEAEALSRSKADLVIQELTGLEHKAGIAPPAQPSIAAALPATVRTAPAATERAASMEACPHPAVDRATDGPFCNRCGATVTP